MNDHSVDISDHPQSRTSSSRMALIAAFLASAALFALLANGVWHRMVFALDTPMMLAIHGFSSPWLDRLAPLISTALVPAAVMLIGGFFWRARLQDAIALTFSGASAAFIEVSAKLIFARPRPHLFPPLLVETDFSFPSGHTLIAAGVFGFAAVRLWHHRRRLAAVLCLVFIGLIAVSRVYMGVHFPSDVLASMILGVMLVSVISACQARFVRQFEKSGLTGGTLDGSNAK